MKTGFHVYGCDRGRRRGTALIATIWVIIVIAGLALVMSRSMRVETLAAANRLAQSQAEATERGAEQFLCSVVDQEVATPGSTALVGMEGRQIGDGYFWVLKMDPNNQQNRAFGLTDEASKIDLNTATLSMLQMLPNITADVGSSIYNWRGTGQAGDGLGATDQDYESLPDPYLAKHAPFETTEELRLVKGVDDTLLFASDTNRDGYLDPSESASGGPAASINSANTSAVGLFPFVTAYGGKATAAAASTSSSTGQRPVNVNLAPTSGQRGATGFNTAALQSALQTAGVSNPSAIVSSTENLAGQGRQFSTLLQWAALVNMTAADLSKVYQQGQLVATPLGGGAGGAGGATTVAKINVNTAPEQVLMCLPGLEQSDADAIIAQRQLQDSSTPTDISWVLTALSDRNKLAGIAGLLTGTSNVFSADIVAVSPDGRAFRRFRIVIDGTKAPAYVIYRRDITRYGWPLSSDIRDALRSGSPPPDANAAATSTNSPFGQGM